MKKALLSPRSTHPLLMAAVFLIGLRLAILPITPPGFFLDEAASGAHAVSMLHYGTNAQGVTWPLFSESLGGGYTTPIYLYPLTGWVSVFGPGELAIRYFSAVMTIFAILLFGYGIRRWLGDREGLVAIVAGLALPWGWLQGSLGWDPALVPLLVAFAFLAFTLILYPTSRASTIAAYIGLPLSLVGLAYLYPPMRVTAPLLFIAAYIVLWRYKKIDVRGIFVTCLGAAIVALPLAEFMFTPAALGRSQALSVFHDTSIVGGLWLAFTNLLQLIGPNFLFITGDPNLRHATGFQGMLGVASLPALIAALAVIVAWVKNHAKPKILDRKSLALTAIGTFGVAASLLGSALTNEGQPHSLRATAVWLFALLIIVAGWRIIFAPSTKRYLTIASISVFVIATTAYAVDLALFYPSRAATSFDSTQRQAIYRHQPTPDYPDLARQYYQTR